MKHRAESAFVFFGIFAAMIREPDIAEFNFAERFFDEPRSGRGGSGNRLVQQFENALGSGHRALQDIKFVAQIPNGTGKSAARIA